MMQLLAGNIPTYPKAAETVAIWSSSASATPRAPPSAPSAPSAAAVSSSRSGTVAARTRSLRRLNEDRLRTVGSHARLARRHHGCDNGGLVCFGGGCRLRWRGFDNNGLGLGFEQPAWW